MRATVVVLGDIGRSPRMQYHALELARRGVDVDLVGEGGTSPLPDIMSHRRIACHPLRPASLRRRAGALFVPAAGLDAVLVTARLHRLLRRIAARADVVLVQTPPALPVLALARVAARRAAARLVIDWHNLGYTLLALRLGAHHPAVRAARRLEQRFGQHADAHLCVSEALRAELVEQWGLRHVTVFADRPHRRFAPIPEPERSAERRRLLELLRVETSDPAIVVSPTSWTADEDFDLLFEALPELDRALGRPLLLLITGQGPRREAFETRARQLVLDRVAVRTAWFAAETYPRVLGVSDAGLCLHRSSSGLDLPMKVVDLLGAGLPVLALDYGACLGEQLPPGRGAMLFTDVPSLVRRTCEVLEGRLPADGRGRGDLSWEEGWAREAWPVLCGDVRASAASSR
jgi:beta-1,4-mannosyltransferase